MGEAYQTSISAISGQMWSVACLIVSLSESSSKSMVRFLN